MKRVMITGASRGLGFELARQCLAQGDQVFAGCRNNGNGIDLRALKAAYPDKLYLLTLDVSNDADIDAAVESIQSLTDGLELLINNAGIGTKENPRALSRILMSKLMEVNCISPTLVSHKCLPLLRNGNDPAIINISSESGSLSAKQNRDYSYSASKAALNMFTRALAFDLAPENIKVMAIHPGSVRTDMGGANAELSPTESAKSLLKTVEELEAANSGNFFSYNGRELPW